VKLAAVKALNNALEFASRNFDVDTERNYILQVICEACTHGSDEVKEYAYQCLSRIAEVKRTCYFYDKIKLTRWRLPAAVLRKIAYVYSSDFGDDFVGNSKRI
jgi:hypothetical protein